MADLFGKDIRKLTVYQVIIVEIDSESYNDKTYFYKEDAEKRIKRIEYNSNEYFSHGYVEETKVTGGWLVNERNKTN